ncbi:hypothetical protein QF028_004370 [Neobacillus sp. B4I6]|uniref:hypothetical protein n=1 Tax=Neobacillus sp. B4I6 TaxID=3373925 RepID=UPI003D19924F
MKIFIQLNGNRVVNQGSTKGADQDIELEVAEDHEVLRNPFVFTYENGQLIKDEAYQQQLIQEKEARESEPSTEEKLELMQKAIDDIILGVI